MSSVSDAEEPETAPTKTRSKNLSFILLTPFWKLRNEDVSAASALQRIIVERDNIEKEQKRATNNIFDLELRAE